MGGFIFLSVTRCRLPCLHSTATSEQRFSRDSAGGPHDRRRHVVSAARALELDALTVLNPIRKTEAYVRNYHRGRRQIPSSRPGTFVIDFVFVLESHTHREGAVPLRLSAQQAKPPTTTTKPQYVSEHLAVHLLDRRETHTMCASTGRSTNSAHLLRKQTRM